jgi:hypothetical protein
MKHIAAKKAADEVLQDAACGFRGLSMEKWKRGFADAEKGLPPQDGHEDYKRGHRIRLARQDRIPGADQMRPEDAAAFARIFA